MSLQNILQTTFLRLFHIALLITIAYLAIDRAGMQYYGNPPFALILSAIAAFIGISASLFGIIAMIVGEAAIPLMVVALVDAGSGVFVFITAFIFSVKMGHTDCNTRWTSSVWVSMSQNPLLNLGSLTFPPSSSSSSSTSTTTTSSSSSSSSSEEDSPLYGYMQLRNPRSVLRNICRRTVALQALLIIAVFSAAGVLMLVCWARRRMVVRKGRVMVGVVGETCEGWLRGEWRESTGRGGYRLLEAIRADDIDDDDDDEDSDEEEMRVGMAVNRSEEEKTAID